MLEEVTHINGDIAKIAENYSKEYKFLHNWCEFHARLKKGKLLGILLHLVFEEDCGPHRGKALTPKDKEWRKQCDDVATRIQEAKQKTQGSKIDSDVSTQLQQVKQDIKNYTMEKARNKAKALMNQRRQDRQVDL